VIGEVKLSESLQGGDDLGREGSKALAADPSEGGAHLDQRLLEVLPVHLGPSGKSP